MRQPMRRVVVLAVPPAEELDVVGPISVFGSANAVLGRRGPAYRTELVSAGSGCAIEGDMGLTLLASKRYGELRGTIDTLLIAGGGGAVACDDAALHRWLRQQAPRVRRLGSICTGAFVLAQAGLLDGRRATTHWMEAARLALRHPRVRVDPEPIWIEDEGVYTSAGVTAGMDLALAMVEDDHGAEVALAVARRLVMFLRRPGSQAQFSATLAAQATRTRSLRRLNVWMLEHLSGDLSVDRLAARVAMSPRNFARRFAREFGCTPARHVERLRTDAAKRLLERDDRSLEAVARDCGFTSAHGLRRAFLRMIGVAPKDYRDRFHRRAPARVERESDAAG